MFGNFDHQTLPSFALMPQRVGVEFMPSYLSVILANGGLPCVRLVDKHSSDMVKEGSRALTPNVINGPLGVLSAA